MKKDRSIHIQFSSIDDVFAELRTALKTQKEDAFAGREVRFESYMQFMNFMFPQKFALLVAIKTEKPRSIYNLAQIVDRHQNAVLKDCDELKALGFIVYEKGERNSNIPKLAFDYNTIIVHAPRAVQTFCFSDAA